MKKYRWIVLITLLGALARLATVGRESLWFDEAISYLTAGLPLSSILDNSIQDPHPPLYYILLHIWTAWFQGSVTAARLVSVIFGIMLIPGVYVLTLELLAKRRLALFCAVLVAVSPFQILYSHELRMYTLLMLLAVVQGISYLRARRKGRLAWWFICGIVSVLMVYTHLFSWFSLMGIGIHAAIRREQRAALAATTAIIGLSLVLFLPWASLLLSESDSGIGSFRPLMQDRSIEFHPFKPITSLTFLMFGESGAAWYVALAFFLALSIIVVLLLEVRKEKGGGASAGLLFPGLMAATLIGLPNVLFFLRPFFLPERTMAAASPYLLILLAWGTTRRRTPLPYLVAAATMVFVAGSSMYLAGRPIKPPYRDAIRLVEERRSEADIVLHTSDGSYLPSLAYVSFPRHGMLAGDPDQRKPDSVYSALGADVWSLSEVTEENGRLWLVVALEHSVEWQLEQVAYLDDSAQELESHQIDDIVVKLYQVGEDQ